ncbi:MAG TPA: phage Gp37/Gp68 family protein [Phycisphaerae bacterium]|nr:phage Gp37/Gp68 family protein [Phycisphaerae bacterium]
MADNSSIEWTDSTWNPVTGCTKVSPGCTHCYADRMAKRLRAMGMPQYRNGFQLTLHEDVLKVPLRWKKPRMVFVNSMSDLFHERVPLDFIRRTFDVMQQASQHTFQVLTKRPEVALEHADQLAWPENVWLGTSVEKADYVHRLRTLRRIPAHIRFLSLEPLLGPITRVPLQDIHWVIVGGESGPGARPMNERWVVQIRNRCLAGGVPFFFKQWGGVNRKRTGRHLDGRTWGEMPRRGEERPYARAAAT